MSIEGILQKRYLYCQKLYIKDKGLDLRAQPPHITLCCVPLSPWVTSMYTDAFFFQSVPNVDLPPLCSSRFRPGPPSEQAQVLSQFVADIISK